MTTRPVFVYWGKEGDLGLCQVWNDVRLSFPALFVQFRVSRTVRSV